MESLGLNERHQQLISSYLKICRSQRHQKARSLERYFTDVNDYRLSLSTYTKDEVVEIISDLRQLLLSEVDAEFAHIAHMSVVLLKQMCSQAEHWHVKLTPDTALMEDGLEIDHIVSFETNMDNIVETSVAASMNQKLEPIELEGIEAPLRAEILRLQEENRVLRDRIKLLESEISNVKTEHTKTLDSVVQKQESPEKEIVDLVNQDAVQENDDGQSASALLDSEFEKMKEELEAEMNRRADAQNKLEGDLTSTKHRLLEVQNQLEMAEQELEKRFSQTVAYANMKRMLSSKNEQIKQLRAQLGGQTY